MDNTIIPKLIPKIKYFILALFLSAGYFKADPRLSWLPVDLTLITALFTAIFVIWEFIKNKFNIPKAVFLLLPFYFLFLPSMYWTDWHSYAIDKTIRFFTLTLLATIAPAFLIRNQKELFSFIKVLVLIGGVMAVDAAILLFIQGGQFTRLTAFGSNTIALGRAVGITFLWIAILALEKRFNYFFALCSMGVLGVVLLSSGSRGPLLAVIVSLVLTIILFLRLSPSMIAILISLVIISLIPILLSYTMLPKSSVQRVEHFMNGEMGDSELQRWESYKVSWKYIKQNPFGIGLGGFASKINLWSGNARQYPHNIILETLLEGGLFCGLYFLILLLLALYKCYFTTYQGLELQSSVFFAIFIFLIFNVMVSGDLNDNKILFTLTGITMGFGRSTDDFT